MSVTKIKSGSEGTFIIRGRCQGLSLCHKRAAARRKESKPLFLANPVDPRREFRFVVLYYFIFCHFYLVLPVTSLIMAATSILTCDLTVFHTLFFPKPLPLTPVRRKKKEKKKKKTKGRKEDDDEAKEEEEEEEEKKNNKKEQDDEEDEVLYNLSRVMAEHQISALISYLALNWYSTILLLFFYVFTTHCRKQLQCRVSCRPFSLFFGTKIIGLLGYFFSFSVSFQILLRCFHGQYWR